MSSASPGPSGRRGRDPPLSRRTRRGSGSIGVLDVPWSERTNRRRFVRSRTTGSELQWPGSSVVKISGSRASFETMTSPSPTPWLKSTSAQSARV